MADQQESWQERRAEYLLRLHPDRLAAITKAPHHGHRDYISVTDRALAFAIGGMLGLLGGLWIIAEILT